MPAPLFVSSFFGLNIFCYVYKYPDAGKDWRQNKKRVAEDETVRQHHWLNGRESEQTLGESEEQGSLACYSPCGCKESDTTEQLNSGKTNEKKNNKSGTRFQVFHVNKSQMF